MLNDYMKTWCLVVVRIWTGCGPGPRARVPLVSVSNWETPVTYISTAYIIAYITAYVIAYIKLI